MDIENEGSLSSDIENPFDQSKQIVDKSVSFAPLPPKELPVLRKEIRKDIAYPQKHDKVAQF
jgi:hypothetical protein